MFSAQQAFSGSQFRISGCCLLVIRISSTDLAAYKGRVAAAMSTAEALRRIFISLSTMILFLVFSKDFPGFPDGNKKLLYLFRNSLAKLDNLS